MQFIRAGTGLTQAEFAARYGLSTASVRDYEQGRREPCSAVMSYLRIIKHDPAGTARTLAVAAPAPSKG